MKIEHRFVEFIPENIEDNVLYISTDYCTTVHKCACGCGNEVVTPLTRTDWKFTFNGESITLHPSIGNWSFKCQSHYWIKENRVVWADGWSQKDIEAGRRNDLQIKADYYSKNKPIEKANPTSKRWWHFLVFWK